ncbi:hypothetical protein [Paraburkholderia dinghuensis]|uniref:hypothetical protein n=1 Tax=Paraburkholderia dinghuensis TaxID=2305225 RepID=UPI001FE5CFD0|nr:hypothetical protein [Paraburkholderia dinghuensis]
MNKLLHVETLLVCLGLTTPALALAQTYDEQQDYADSGNCREVVGQAEIDGVTQDVAERACLQSDGTWQIVQGSDGSALWYPVASYPYPDPWWWGPPVFIGVGVSFIFVDHFHHVHHFAHFRPFGRGRFKPVGGGFHRAPFPGSGMHGFSGPRGAGGMSGFRGTGGSGGTGQFRGMGGFGGMGRR